MEETLEQREAGKAPDESVAWLQGIAYPGEARPTIARPWLVDLNGEKWTVATDGMRLVLLRGDFGYAPRGDAPNLAPVLGMIGGQEYAVDLAALRSFIGPDTILPDPLPDCEKCKNTGSVDCPMCEGNGTVDDTCWHCQSEYEKDCEECDDGKIGCECYHDVGAHEKPEPVSIFGGAFNRHLLRLPLLHLGGERATWQQQVRSPGPHGHEKAGMLDGGDWRLVVMPMRCENVGELATFPPTPLAKSAVDETETSQNSRL